MPLSTKIAPHLPYLRRYARALAGSQAMGDAVVRQTLEAIVAAPGEFPADVDPRLGLYRVFQLVWRSSQINKPIGDGEPGTDFQRVAQQRLAAISPKSREALLLTAMEGFSNADAAYLIGTTPAHAAELTAEALAEIDRQTATRVLIIEDEPIIAMDIEHIVRDLGHGVTGIAATRTEARQMIEADRPGLVLADIQLADGSSGIDAVRDILAQFSVPAIFITAFPERLLTGERPEPTFLITKPFQRATVKAAISQALFFNSTAAFAT